MPTYRITGPDGATYRVEAPNDEALDAAVGQMFGGAVTANEPSPTPSAAMPPAPVPSGGQRSLVDLITAGSGAPTSPTPALAEDRSWLSAIMGVVDQTGRGLAEGVTNIAGLPRAVGDLQAAGTDWALNKAGAPEWMRDAAGAIVLPRYLPSAEDMQGALDSANNATADAISVERPRGAPDNFAERFANRAAEEVGAMLVPAGAIANKMQKTGRGIAAIDPAAYWSKEFAVASGAGMGAAAANEVVPGSPLADLVGALGGAVATGVGSSLMGSAGDILSAIFQRDKFVDQVVKDTVVDRVGRAAGLSGADDVGGVMDTAPLTNAIDDTARPRPSTVIPGYQETLADRTGNAGIASLEYGRAAGPSAGVFNTLKSNNNQAVDRAMARLAPTETPGALRSTVEAERDRRLLDLIMGQENAATAANSAARAVAPAMTAAERGGTVREALETARETARARTEDAYSQVNIAGRQVDPAPLAQSLDQAIGNLTEVERGLIPQGVLDRVRSLGRPLEDGAQPSGLLDASGNMITRPPQGPAPVSLKEATDLKSELQRLQRAAQADPRAERGGRNASRVIGQMIDTVDTFIGSNLDEADRTALETARGAKFDEAERFTRQGDPVARTLGRYDGGQPQVADERVAGLFVNPQAMDRLFAQADTPEVRAAIRDEVLSRGDTSSAERITNFMNTYSGQVDRFPGLRDELTRAAEARGAEATATTNRQAFERIYGTPERERGTGTIGKYLQFGDAQSERAISEVLSSRDPAKAADELMTFVGDNPRAVEGARAAFWQKLRTESRSAERDMKGGNVWRGDWLKGFLNDPSASSVAERLYRDKPQDLEALRAYADVLDNVDLRYRGKASGTSGTAQGISNILTPETIQSRTYAWMRGQISGTYLATSMAAVFARRAVRGARSEAIERLTDKVLLNPDMARELLKDNNPANRQALARKAKEWLGNEAATVVNMLNEDDGGKTNSVIMRD